MGWVVMIVYIFIGICTGVLSTVTYWKSFPDKYSRDTPSIDHRISGYLTGTFWPIGLPLFLVCLIYSKLMKLALKRFS